MFDDPDPLVDSRTRASGRHVIYCDGGARGNPGPAGIGAVILLENGAGSSETLATVSKFIGVTTNNVAEYTALIEGLKEAKKLGARVVEIRCDSELVVRQLSGEYKVKSSSLKCYHAEAKKLLSQFDDWVAVHVTRDLNVQADRLVNDAIDRHLSCKSE